MSGVASVAELWGLSREVGTYLSAILITVIVFFCRYRQVEIIGVTLGLCELSFVVTMFCLHPSPGEVFQGMFDYSHWHSKGYLKLIAANIGAVIMPWMIYFQQSAVVARRLSVADVKPEQAHTFLGCCLTQLIMIAT